MNIAPPIIHWKTGDTVIIECNGQTVSGNVMLASPNSKSLMLKFDVILADHAGMMPVLRHDRSIATGCAVLLSRAH